MMQSFFIEGVLPGMNEMIGAANTSRHVYNKMKKEQQLKIIVYARNAKIKMVPQVFFEFIWVEPNGRRELDNIAAAKKFVIDALKGIAFVNDTRKYVIGFRDRFKVNKARPGVFVVLHEKEQ